MTAVELSDYLRVHPNTIYRLLKTKKIPSFRIGSEHRFSRQTIDEWVRGLEAKSAPPTQELQPAAPAQPRRRGRPPRVNNTSRSPS
jgi:excisionase family DNA binding protein